MTTVVSLSLEILFQYECYTISICIVILSYNHLNSNFLLIYFRYEKYVRKSPIVFTVTLITIYQTLAYTYSPLSII